MAGALAWVASGTRHQADWAWLMGSRVVQMGSTPMHRAASQGQEEAIRALVAAKADVHAKDKVKGGGILNRTRGGFFFSSIIIVLPIF